MKKLLALVNLIILAGSLNAATNFSGLYQMNEGSGSTLTDSSGNARHSTAGGTFNYLSLPSRVLEGAYGIKWASGAGYTLPNSVMADIQANTRGAIGVAMFCEESMFNNDGVLVSFKPNGKDGMIYQEWAGGNRDFIVRWPTSGGNQVKTSTAITWQPGKQYGLWLDIYPTGYNLMLRDFSSGTDSIIIDQTPLDGGTTTDLSSMAGVYLARYTDGSSIMKMGMDLAFFTGDALTAWPSDVETNWGVNKGFTVTLAGDSSWMSYVCDPDLTTYLYEHAAAINLEKLVDAPGNSLNPKFHLFGTGYHTPHSSTAQVASPMDEAYSGETAASALTHFQSARANLFRSGTDGTGWLYFAGPTHGNAGNSSTTTKTGYDAWADTVIASLANIKFIYVPMYTIGAGGVTANMGVHASYLEKKALYPSRVYYWDVTRVVSVLDTCADATHLQRTPYAAMMADMYSFMLTLVPTATATATPTFTASPTATASPTYTATNSPTKTSTPLPGSHRGPRNFFEGPPLFRFSAIEDEREGLVHPTPSPLPSVLPNPVLGEKNGLPAPTRKRS